MSDLKKIKRREFILNLARLGTALILGIAAGRASAIFDKVKGRMKEKRRWRINPDKCIFCGGCATACVRKPSAVKAVNDQKKCSFCVVCYGHISNYNIETSKIDSEGIIVCPYNAVQRKNYCGGPEGYYIYSIDHSRCIGCGLCASRCNELGSKSMFLIIRPDLCLGCNRCSIAAQCPANAIELVEGSTEDDFKGEYPETITPDEIAISDYLSSSKKA